MQSKCNRPTIIANFKPFPTITKNEANILFSAIVDSQTNRVKKLKPRVKREIIKKIVKKALRSGRSIDEYTFYGNKPGKLKK
uniref:Uncharacterized protein n=1 Tax=viral metagenome TaxID=1070528 RepID=A0A6C0F674_9ZZZZ|tara:strand:- start:18664 stop:18909 length:246 start_codon:yes stop_codon:yes gene_type:complete